MRWQRENLLMIERLGVNTDWAEKSKLAYASCSIARAEHPWHPGGSSCACCGAGEASGGSSPPFRPRSHRGEVPDGTRPVDSDVAGRQVL